MLQAGDRAPDFTLDDQAGERITLSGYRGSWMVLYFYPRDNTPGCTLEARDFTCLQEEFAELGVRILGVSRDSAESHRKFSERQSLTLTLASDPDHVVMEAYGAWREKKMYGKIGLGVIRSTFLIDPQGMIVRSWYNVRAKGHAAAVLACCHELCGKT